ncbi:MAG TPA: hypothetical protein VNM15_01730 [Candidatus Binatia bacterium]|nr:hypothetical protein [Candidatus Binatia bacterium]
MNGQIRLQIYLFLVAVPLNLIWEVAQMEAYDFPTTSLIDDIIGCFVPSLGDGLMTLIIFWIGWLAFRDSEWIFKPGVKGYGLMLVMGIFLAVVVELNALYVTGAWNYNERMVTVLGVGVLPVLQMIVLPPATAVLLQQIWKRRDPDESFDMRPQERRKST